MGSDEYPTEINIRGYKPNTTVHVGQVKKACSIISKAKRPLSKYDLNLYGHEQ